MVKKIDWEHHRLDRRRKVSLKEEEEWRSKDMAAAWLRAIEDGMFTKFPGIKSHNKLKGE